jgi:hypothetical protein
MTIEMVPLAFVKGIDYNDDGAGRWMDGFTDGLDDKVAELPLRNVLVKRRVFERLGDVRRKDGEVVAQTMSEGRNEMFDLVSVRLVAREEE